MPLVAIVGTRHPSEYGRHITYKLAYELASSGIGIVSGMALGIDAIAHQGALDAGGYTIAVQACGLDSLYPATNRSLGTKILDSGGAILSEYEKGTPPLKQHFVARNRIVSGLSLGCLITEANAVSGSLITANFALDQNRLVMAVPGNITSLSSAGPNNLLRSGAAPVTSASDVLSALDLVNSSSELSAVAKSQAEAKILQLLAGGVSSGEELIDQSQLSAGEFAQVISLMEITGKVRNLGAGNWMAR